MKVAVRVLALAVLTALLSCTYPALAQGGKKQSVLQQADAAWEEQSYCPRAGALSQGAAKRQSLLTTMRWSFALPYLWARQSSGMPLLQPAKLLLNKTTWKARVLYWMGRLYTVVPHQGYKIGDRIYRGQDYPRTEGADKPQQIWLAEEDAQATLSYFERAKVAAQQERELVKHAIFKEPIHRLGFGEEIDLNFDLAAFLPLREYDEFIKALDAKADTR
jgi:hypothetical protein